MAHLIQADRKFAIREGSERLRLLHALLLLLQPGLHRPRGVVCQLQAQQCIA